MARKLTYPEQQRFNPFRRPCWRWDRANQLVRTGQYMSRKRDDRATGIAVQYLRELDKCVSDLRFKRFKKRFRYIVNAHAIWQGCGHEKLELETRMLARQTDVEIGLGMNLPAATVQAYADLFFHLGERIDADSYIMRQIIRWNPTHPPNRLQLAQACVYHHGPHLIAPIFNWLSNEDSDSNLDTAAGRLSASFDLLLAIHSLPEGTTNQLKMLKRMPFWLENEWQFSQSVTAAAAFRKSTASIVAELGLPAAELEPFSYAPVHNRTHPRTDRQQIRQAA